MLTGKLKKLWQGKISPGEVSKGIRSELLKELKKLWFGEMPLDEIFTKYIIICNLIIFMSICLLSIYWTSPSLNVISLLTILTVPYWVIVTVGIWRSSEHYKENIMLEILAKLFTIYLTYGTCESIIEILAKYYSI